MAHPRLHLIALTFILQAGSVAFCAFFTTGYLLWLNNDLICIEVADGGLHQRHLRGLKIPPAGKVLTYTMFSCVCVCVFFTFLHGDLGRIASIPNLCLLSYLILSRTQTTGDVLSNSKQLGNR